MAEQRRRLAPCGTISAYMRHHRWGEKPCGPCRDASRDYNRKYRPAARWQVYVIRFADGLWYYGHTRYPLSGRVTPGHIRKRKGRIGAHLRAGVPFTMDTLMWCDSKELATQMEARFILASDRAQLLNEKVPWHFCWETNPGLRAYSFHHDRGETPCPPAVEARRAYQQEYERKHGKRRR